MTDPEAKVERCTMADSSYREGRCWLVAGHPMLHLSMMGDEEIRYDEDGAVPFVPPKKAEP